MVLLSNDERIGAETALRIGIVVAKLWRSTISWDSRTAHVAAQIAEKGPTATPAACVQSPVAGARPRPSGRVGPLAQLRDDGQSNLDEGSGPQIGSEAPVDTAVVDTDAGPTPPVWPPYATVPEMIRDRTEAHGPQEFVVGSGRRLTYADADHQSATLARALGVGRRERHPRRVARADRSRVGSGVACHQPHRRSAGADQHVRT